MGLNLVPWVIAGFLALGGVGYFLHCEEVKKDQANFLGQMKAEAEAQQRGNKKRSDREKAEKEKADERIQNDLKQLHGTIARMRNAARSSPRELPKPTADASGAFGTCFDWAKLNDALGKRREGLDRYRATVLGITVEGTENTIKLDGVKGWALKLDTDLKQD